MTSKTREFELNKSGVKEKLAWITTLENDGYEVQSEAIVPAETQVGKMICLGMLFFPILIFSNLYRTPARSIVRMKKQ